MTCKETQRLLPGFLDDALDADGKTAIEAHVAGCPHCRAALEALQKTATLLHDLSDVEPPPWFTQKVMASVRDEQKVLDGRRIWDRLFRPWHIKIPIEALTAAMVAVVAVQVYRYMEPVTTQVEEAFVPVTHEASNERPADRPLETAKEALREVPIAQAPALGRSADIRIEAKKLTKHAVTAVPRPAKESVPAQRTSMAETGSASMAAGTIDLRAKIAGHSVSAKSANFDSEERLAQAIPTEITILVQDATQAASRITSMTRDLGGVVKERQTIDGHTIIVAAVPAERQKALEIAVRKMDVVKADSEAEAKRTIQTVTVRIVILP